MSNVGSGDYNIYSNNFLKLAGAGYSIHTTYKNRDVNVPVKLNDYWLSGFDGAFAGKCLDDFVTISFGYIRPIKDYVIDSYVVNSITKSFGSIVGYIWGNYVDSVVSDQLQKTIGQLLEVLITSMGSILNTADVILLCSGFVLLLAYALRKEKLEQIIGDSEKKKIVASFALSIFTARLAGCFNATLVDLVYLTILARRKIEIFKKATDFFVVDPLTKNLRKRWYEFAELMKKGKLDDIKDEDKTLKHKAVDTFLSFRKSSPVFKSVTDSLVQKKVDKKFKKETKKMDSSDQDIDGDRKKKDKVSTEGVKKKKPLPTPNPKIVVKDKTKVEDKTTEKSFDKSKDVSEMNPQKETEVKNDENGQVKGPESSGNIKPKKKNSSFLSSFFGNK